MDSPLAKAMKDRMTDQQLADKVGVDRSFITRIRQNKRRPSLDLALKIAKEVGLPVEELAA